MKNVTLCINEIKMGILAKAMIHPGANTMLMNLLHSQTEAQAAANAEILGAASTPAAKKMIM
jgi:hypothetical protein